eukprot:m.270887 g.270887  ORF g.270887 m.270887 type:complete len:509 (-) comp19744_c0_seq11:143-1669(-)
MKENTNTCVYGKEVALIPYLDKHVAYRHRWLNESPGNRLDRSATPPTIAEEEAKQKEFTADKLRCTFLVADAERLGDPDSDVREPLLGEAHLIKGRVADDDGNAVVEIMLTDRSVRRRALICETLLLLIKYGSDNMQLSRFSVIMDAGGDPATENRVLFASRRGNGGGGDEGTPDDGGGAAVSTATKVVKSSPARPQKSSKGTDSPGRARKGSGVTRAMARIGQSVKKVFKHEKTDYLARLTRHLLKEDDGDHWPAELDFELVENNRIELELNKASLAVLHRSVAHAKVITYSSVVLDGAGRSAQRTRIDGRTVVLVPYSAPLVGVVHAWMQKVDMYTGFGVQPPTLEQEQHAQAMMAADDDCHSFVVCSKVNVGDERCPVHPEGRAQIVLLDSGVAQVHVGLVQPDVDLRAFMHREVLLMLFMYIRQTLPVHTVSMLAATTVRPKPDAAEELWSRRLVFEPCPDDPDSFMLDLDDVGVKVALRKLCRNMVVRDYNPSDVVYEDGTMA